MTIKARFQSLIQDSRKALATILVVTGLVYLNTLNNDFIMDDLSFVVDWPLIHSFNNLPRFFWGYIPPEAQIGIYSPLRTVLFSVNYQWWGLVPAGYHVFSIVVHLAGTSVVYLLTRRLLKAPGIAFLTGMFFGTHPIHAENIAGITASVDTAGIVLMLMSFDHYVGALGDEGTLAFSPEGRPAAGNSPPRAAAMGTPGSPVPASSYRWAVVLGALAVFTHELVMSLPFLLVFYEVCCRKDRSQVRDIWRRTWPFFLTVIVYVILKAAVLGSITRGHYLYHSPMLNLMVVIKAWAKYLWVLVFPRVLTHDRIISPGIFSFDENDFVPEAVLSQSFFQPQMVASLVLIIGLIALAVKARRHHPLFLFCAGWFFLCLLPVAGIVPSSVFYGERYLYAGSWAFCLLLAWLITRLIPGAGSSGRFGRMPEEHVRRLRQSLAVILGCGLVAAYSVRTMLRNEDLSNQVSFYEAAVRANPDSAALRNDLGIVYSEYGLFDKAVASFQKAIEIKPDDPHQYFSFAETCFQYGQLGDAEKHYLKAIDLNPDFAEAYYNLASVYATQGRKVRARDHLDKAIAAFRKQGRILEAGEYARQWLDYAKEKELQKLQEMKKSEKP